MRAIVTLICSVRHTDIPILRMSGIKFSARHNASGPPLLQGDEAAEPLHIAARTRQRLPAPAGESREGAALFGGGLGVPPPTPVRSASRQGSGRTSVAGTGALRRRAGASLRMLRKSGIKFSVCHNASGPPLLQGSEAAEPLHIAARATRRLPARRESPERTQPSLVGA